MRRSLPVALIVLLAACLPHVPPPTPPPPGPICVCPSATVQDGCLPCPPTPPPVTTGHLDGTLADGAGAPYEAAHVQYVLNGTPLAGEALSVHAGNPSGFPAGYFSRPGEERFGVYTLKVTLADGRHGTVGPVTFDASWHAHNIVPVLDPIVEPPPPPTNGNRKLGALFDASRMMLDFSMYDALAVKPEVRAVDFQKLADADFDAIEVWLIWPRTPDTDVLDSHGSWIPGGGERLKALLDQAQSYGLYVSTRVSACALARSSSHDSASQEQIVRSFAARKDIAEHPALLGLDMANEGDNRTKAKGGASTGYCHQSKGEFSKISKLGKQIAPKLRLTVSIAGPADGPIDENAGITPSGTWYCTAVNDGSIFGYFAPHDPRSTDSGHKTESFVNRERAALNKCNAGAIPIALVEPFRDNHTPAHYKFSLSEYEAAIRGARKARAALWCLHDGPDADIVGKSVWYDPKRSTIEQLNATQQAVIPKARAWAQ